MDNNSIAGESVLVTGGAGFIGSHLSSALLDHGAHVCTVDNLTKGSEEFIPAGATTFTSDIQSDQLAEIVEDVTPKHVIHLAAHHYVPFCNENPEEAFNVNVMGTRNLLDACEPVESIERLVFASSAAVYRPKNEPHKETDALHPICIYGRTKLVGEDLVDKYHQDTGVDTVSLRLFNVYGPNETNDHLIPTILDQVKDNGTKIDLGNLSPKRDFVHVSDITNSFIAALTEVDGNNRHYNVGTGDSYSVREVVEATSEVLGRNINIRQDEERVRESDRPNLCADSTLLQRDTSWEPTVRLVDGLSMMAESAIT